MQPLNNEIKEILMRPIKDTLLTNLHVYAEETLTSSRSTSVTSKLTMQGTGMRGTHRTTARS
jgi:hypothetical protein